MAKTEPSAAQAFRSFHGFIFPFDWKRKNTSGDLLEVQTDLIGTNQYFISDKRWARTPIGEKPASKTQYNEAAYFYEFVRPGLYDYDQQDTLLNTYRFDISENFQFIVEAEKQFKYRLRIASIELRLYRMGVGVLSFQLINELPDQVAPEDILRINQYSRRLFPPFYLVENEHPGADTYYTEQSWDNGLANHPEIPDRLAIYQGEKEIWSETYTEYRERPAIGKPPGLLRQLLPKQFIEQMHITPVLDDRMFVVCWYGNDDLAAEIKQEYREHDWWYRYLFVDVSRTVQNRDMMADLLTRHSYMRWSDWGTMFGVARYSMVCLTGAQPPAFLVAHVRTLYMRMAELALLQRACVLRFSEEVTGISSIDTHDPQLDARMSSLFRQYLRFVNKFSFKEITAQEQGIEMYDLLRQSMRLDEQVSALEAEIRELHNYAASLAEDARNAKLDLLTYIGAYLAGPGFIVSYYAGIGYSMREGYHWLVMIFLFIIYSLLIWQMMQAKGRWRAYIGIVVLAFVFIALFWVPHFFK